MTQYLPCCSIFSGDFNVAVLPVIGYVVNLAWLNASIKFSITELDPREWPKIKPILKLIAGNINNEQIYQQLTQFTSTLNGPDICQRMWISHEILLQLNFCSRVLSPASILNSKLK